MDIDNSIVNLGTAGRLARGLIGAVLIGVVMVQTDPLGWLAILPLIAVYPIFSAITGVDPVRHAVTMVSRKLVRGATGSTSGLQPVLRR